MESLADKSPNDDAFNRIFYSDEQLAEAYEHGVFKHVPIQYLYCPYFMEKLAEMCLLHHEEMHIANEYTIANLPN